MLDWITGWKRVQERRLDHVDGSSRRSWETIRLSDTGIAGERGKRAPVCTRDTGASMVGSHATRLATTPIAPTGSWDISGEAFLPYQ